MLLKDCMNEIDNLMNIIIEYSHSIDRRLVDDAIERRNTLFKNIKNAGYFIEDIREQLTPYAKEFGYPFDIEWGPEGDACISFYNVPKEEYYIVQDKWYNNKDICFKALIFIYTPEDTKEYYKDKLEKINETNKGD